ncbi:unnamed protein product [Darwinula stevensoni]|uniref:Death domain-containing protein n=1 Tax=Darwinula stevensoni TaxID=69355 RepID=A0A7R8X7S8_9CRUS|nr:unnamed protein product [Darwinula stevensoni]CAG0888052.1 unnamed protein product [Darwinula stevensoni]
MLIVPISGMDRIKRLRSILSDKNTNINVLDFLRELSKEELISPAEEKDIRRKETYSEKIDSIFDIVFVKNPMKIEKKLIEVLESMEREDIIDRWNNDSVVADAPGSLRDILLASWGIMLEQLKAGMVAIELRKSGVISKQDLDEIMTPRDTREKRSVLLAKLSAKIDSRNFKKFISALTVANQTSIAENLQAEEGKLERGKSQLANALLDTTPSDGDIRQIANGLEEAWDKWGILGKELGLTKAAIDEIERKELDPVRSTYLLLREWRKLSLEDHPATFRVLHEALCNQGMISEVVINLICKKNCEDIKSIL